MSADELASLLHRLTLRTEHLELTLITLIAFLAQSKLISPTQHRELGQILSDLSPS
jgi:hypothetical protein